MSDLLPEKQRLAAHLTALEAFLGSPAYVGWESARSAKLTEVEEALLELDPVDRKGEIESFKLRGERRLLQDLQNQFQDVRETLRSRLDEIEELLTPNTENTKQDDE